MGIRFRCHQCGHELHVKDFQGGKRSKCPECETKFRIPAESADYSIPLDNPASNDSARDDTSISPQSRSASSVATEALPTKSSPSKVASTTPSSSDTDPEATNANDEPQEISPVSDSVSPTSLQAILEAPSATWYVRPPAGGQYGPAPADIFCEWLVENRVTRDSLVWRDGWPQWLIAGDVFSDYFGPPTSNPAPELGPALGPTPGPAPSVSASVEQANAPKVVAPTSLSDRALAARKRQRKKNYMIMIGILATISVGLVIALVVVLMRNS